MKKKFFKSGLLFCVATVFIVKGSSQNHQSYEMPKVIPAFGTAAAFARYGEIPVNISTGVPGIEVPIYTITSRKLSVPLSLSYHASGIKVDDIPTPVGLGWVLNGMGLVSRTVLDWPDEIQQNSNSGLTGKAVYPSKEAYDAAVANCPNTYAARSILGDELNKDLKFRDNQSDRFTYSLPGAGTGTFRYDFNNGNCILAPYKPVRISAGYLYTTFAITDENGNIYNFNKAYNTQYFSCANCYNGTANSSWYLTSITSPDGSDVIEYQYRNDVTHKYTLTSYNHTFSSNIMVPGTDCGASFSEYTPCVTKNRADQSNMAITTFEPLLDKIISATTIVEFNYTNDRTDWVDATNRLTSIKVYDKLNNLLIKEVALDNNAYFGSAGQNNLRLKLNSATVKGNNGQTDHVYSFEYEGDQYTLPPFSSFSQDFWGYYNGYQNSGLVPREFMPANPGATINGTYYYGYRKANHTYAKAGMIKAIHFPTGGKTTFEFEPNFAQGIFTSGNSGLTDDVGGFRVKKILNYIDNSSVVVSQKEYIYSQPDFPHFMDAGLYSYSLQYNWDYSMCSSSPGGGGPYRGVYQSSSFSSLTFSNGAPVIYKNVIEYDGSVNANNGKTEYLFSSPDDFRPEPWTNIYGSFWFDNGSYDSKLLNKKDYKKVGGSYLSVGETVNTYANFRNTEYSTGATVIKTSYDVNGTDSYFDHGYQFGGCCPTCPPPYITYFSYVNSKVSEKVSLLTQSEEKYYAPDGIANVSTLTNFTYGNLNHLLPTEKTVTSSGGEIFKATYQYPQDNTTDAFASSMVQANILTPVIEEKNYKNTTFLNSTKTFYTTVPGTNGMIVPASVQSTRGTNSPEFRLLFHQYDVKGNLLDISKVNDVHETYLYGYNSAYPVAKIVGSNWFNASQLVTQSVLDNPPADEAVFRSYLNTLQSIPGALVTTYTYKPLVGITSETDPNGRTSYYEYDAFNRLVLIRDKDNKIIKKFCYNYAGQTENCNSM